MVLSVTPWRKSIHLLAERNSHTRKKKISLTIVCQPVDSYHIGAAITIIIVIIIITILICVFNIYKI